jgi:choline dehydrogenase-like flavoprotein
LSAVRLKYQAQRDVRPGEEPIVIIGSGPAGAAAALALTQRGLPVAMLESGERMPSGLLIRAGGRTIFRFRPRRAIRQVALVAPADTAWLTSLEPGGLSNHWTGAVPRFSPLDFADGARAHERYRWPVTYDELAPYYDRVERVLRIAGPGGPVCGMPSQQVAFPKRLPSDWLPAVEAAARFGQGLCPTPLAGGAPWAVTRSARAFTSLAIIRHLLANPHFGLRLGAHALQVLWDSRLRRAAGVLYKDRATGATNRIRARAVILAAGPLSSTKLLFDSACSDFPDGLGNTEGLLGSYLHDHFHDMFVIELNHRLSRLGHSAVMTRAPHATTPPMAGVQLTLGGRASRLERLLTFTPLRTRTFGVIAFGSTTPVETNTARPDRVEKDEFSFPALRVHLKFTIEERLQALHARDRLMDILEAAGFLAQVTWSMPAHRAGSSVHYGGTIRMHESPTFGMTDGWCRLHAVRNVAVADASCFTTAVEKNPVLTVMALATRACDRIADDLKTER